MTNRPKSNPRAMEKMIDPPIDFLAIQAPSREQGSTRPSGECGKASDWEQRAVEPAENTEKNSDRDSQRQPSADRAKNAEKQATGDS